MARESQPGLYGKPCYAAIRFYFYTDGVVMSGNHCPESENDAQNWDKITQWLRLENIGAPRGDYFVLTGHDGKYTIQTDPGELCTLTYRTPDGINQIEGGWVQSLPTKRAFASGCGRWVMWLATVW